MTGPVGRRQRVFRESELAAREAHSDIIGKTLDWLPTW
ncbi:hypothetical protein SGPA1_21259 [Streptomyces misionensis JCM 4497]